MLKNYIKIAVRNLKQNKIYSIISILGLAIGIAGCLMIALYVQEEISYDRFNEKAEQIYRVNFSVLITTVTWQHSLNGLMFLII